jgi:hypothetical protein
MNSTGRPAADGRPARRMNSASRGLAADGRPAPTGRVSFASAEADAWREAPWKADFNRRESLRPTVGPGRRMNSASRGLAAGGRPAPTESISGVRRRPTPGAKRPGRLISIGVKACGRRSACADRKASLASAEADAWREAPWKADFNRHESLRPAVGPGRRMNSASRGLAADGRPAPTESIFGVGGGRRPARSALEGRFQSA